MPPSKCPYLNRCDKYTELTLKIDRLTEMNEAKDRRIAVLEAENAALKNAQCGGKSNPATVRPFGSSTPSSKIPVKPNSSEENRRRRGGRKKGHAGCGRDRFMECEIDEKVDLPKPATCPDCGHEFSEWTSRTRDVIDIVPAKHVKQQFTIYRGWCPHCRKHHESKVPGVMPNFTFSNRAIAQIVTDHYRNGIPMGTLGRRSFVGKSALYNIEHKTADLLKDGMKDLLTEFRHSPVKHADETTWPNDGRNGYAWGFFTTDISLYRFRETRGAEVPREVFGDGEHIGVLGVDRYSAYNSTWHGKMQYCFEHLKRNVNDLIEAEPNNKEYKERIPPFIQRLQRAMRLRNELMGAEYNRESRRLRDEILGLIRVPVKDGKLKGLFDLMNEKRDRFFQWVEHPEVEAENNMAERGLRHLVVARKVCFGSQSEKGLKTRETLMSIIDTLALRNADPVAKLTEVLDAIARNPKADVNLLLWGRS